MKIPVAGFAFLFAASALLLIHRVAAFPRPEISADSVFLAIEGFEQDPVRPGDRGVQALRCREVPCSGALKIPVVLKNLSRGDFSGRLRVSLNGDWAVAPADGVEVVLKSGETMTFGFDAKAGESVLPALYPVCARLVPRDGGESVEVRAVVKAVTPNRAFKPFPAKLRGVTDAVCRPQVSADTCARAAKLALGAYGGAADPGTGAFLLKDGDTSFGAGYAPGPGGVIDGVFAFTDGERVVSIAGFECWVDGVRVESQKEIPWADISVCAERGALKVKWSSVRRVGSPDGSPRFTRLAPGAASESVSRVYGGFGYVWEKPRKFTLNAGAFGLSTRHAGIDYGNGMSMVVAVDVPPDRLEVDGDRRIGVIATHNDATFFFVPGVSGAFDAAKRFAAVSGYETSPGHRALVGRMCLDDWSGLYEREADALGMAAKYGLSHSVYVQHSSQRWGYDVRLPDVYPPKGDLNGFMRMAGAAKNAGMLFGVHDNFVDYYPDADGFSYDSICFRADGVPQDAWYNPGPRDLSYRWLPSAIFPSIRRNMAWARSAFAPTALFLDVFSASYPRDFIDRNGVFHPARETQRHWCEALNECRRAGGNGELAVISEAGNDALIGHLDAGVSDHYLPEFVVHDRSQYAAAERVPWHDAVSHGKMILFGGGLGSRYCMLGWSKPGDVALHGFATDDYFCTTVIGGRAPICGGGFGRDAVKTYWMLHDVCDRLARGKFTGFRFADGIMRQHSVFSTGEVWINRRTNSVWSVGDVKLPDYGFLVRTDDGREAGVVLKDGVRAGYSKGPCSWFVDARPPAAGDGKLHEVEATAESWHGTSESSGTISVRWKLRRPVDKAFIPFVHGVPEDAPRRIAFHAVMTPLPEGDIVVKLPGKLAPGRYAVRYGFFSKTGARLQIGGLGDGTGRVRGGILKVGEKSGDPVILGWERESAVSRDLEFGLNVARRMVDFGGLRTDGAFRIDFPEMKIIPLPGSVPFNVEIEMNRFGISGPCRFVPTDSEPEAGMPQTGMEGGVLKVSFDAKSFAYELRKGAKSGSR